MIPIESPMAEAIAGTPCLGYGDGSGSGWKAALASVTAALHSLGVTSPVDIAGLQVGEIQEMLAEVGQDVPQEVVEHVRSVASGSIQVARIARGAELFASCAPPPDSPSVAAWIKAASKPLRPGQAPLGGEPDAAVEVVNSKTLQAATNLLDLFTENQLAPLRGEDTSEFDQWKAAMAEALAMKHGKGSLDGARCAWDRLLQWLPQEASKSVLPQPVVLRAFLSSQGVKGPTVAAGLYSNFKFLQDHLLLDFKIQDKLVEPFCGKYLKHLPEQKDVLQFPMWSHLVDMARSGEGIASAAMVVLRFVSSNLRFEHTKRAVLNRKLSTPRDMVYDISFGKDKLPFRCAVPVFMEAGWPVNAVLQDVLIEAIGKEAAESFMIPLMTLAGDNAVQIHACPASFVKFTALLRALLQLHPLSLSDEAAARVTTYSARRLQPTIADALKLDTDARDSLGNWRDAASRKEPMHVRYSAFRLQRSGDTKRLCLKLMTHVSRLYPDSPISRLAGARPHVQATEAMILQSAWGSGSEAVDAPSFDAEPVEPPLKRLKSEVELPVVSPSSDSEEDEPSGPQDENEMATEAALFQWIKFPKGTVVHAASPEDHRKPVCPVASAPVGAELGVGVWSLVQLGMPLCPRCALRLPEHILRYCAD